MAELAAEIRAQYCKVRRQSETLCAGLEPEDLCLQGMADTSPLKWHLAHTTWFFETFVLKPFHPGYRAFDDCFEYLFNSYYNAVGRQYPRPQRHLLSRPTVQQIVAYRQAVDECVLGLLAKPETADSAELCHRLILGLNHEQQHQELMLTDLKYCLSLNPLAPVYNDTPIPLCQASPMTFSDFPGGDGEMGCDRAGGQADSVAGFRYDNEGPRHRVWRAPFALANRLVTNGEYIEFIEAGGYRTPAWWHSDGWATVQSEQWRMPLYWRREGHSYRVFTLHGELDVDPAAPVCHVSLYEAQAFAAWKNLRLCREPEWELAAEQVAPSGQLWNSQCHHPLAPPTNPPGPEQLYGDVWEWTQSAYCAYPGYRAQAGALGEYNGKFMLNQMVLRGGSVATPADHIRATYRNFFYPRDRWQFSGIRLAYDL